MKKEKKVSKIVLVFLLLLLLLLFFCFSCGIQGVPSVAEYEENVTAITKMDYEQRQQAVDTLVEEGKMNVNYSPKAVFDGQKSVLFNVKNIPNNHAPIRFEIYDEQSRCIYASKQIEQGYEINQIQLDTGLEKGIHDCTIKIGYAGEGNVSSVFPLSIEVRK